MYIGHSYLQMQHAHTNASHDFELHVQTSAAGTSISTKRPRIQKWKGFFFYGRWFGVASNSSTLGFCGITSCGGASCGGAIATTRAKFSRSPCKRCVRLEMPVLFGVCLFGIAIILTVMYMLSFLVELILFLMIVCSGL